MPEQIRRPAGYININGQTYLVSKDGKSGEFSYKIESTPKTQVVSRRMDASTGKTNIVEGIFRGLDGFASTKLKNSRSSYVYSSENYHFALNVFTENEGEWIVLPSPRPIVPDSDFINNIFNKPAVVWEQYDDAVSPSTTDSSLHPLKTYFAADHRAFSIQVQSYEQGMPISLDEDFFFEGSATPTGGCVFDNTFYCAMGGGQRSTDRYLRQRISTSSGTTNGTWTNDDNNPLKFDSVASGMVVHTTTAHGYSVGEVVFISGSSVAAYDGLWTISAVTDSTHFTLGSATFSATATGTVNLQDSDVKAEQLVVAGDLMYRSFYTTTDGWQVAAVDPVGSNPNLDADWTAGVGTLGVGDANEPITALVAAGSGVGIGKAEGFFIYDKVALAYMNQIPELENHRHPDNCRGLFVWEGWVYIPTVIGLMRWKNGVVQNVTPGRGQTIDFETPGIPIAYITGDMNRLYAVTKPYQLNKPINVEDTVAKFGVVIAANGDTVVNFTDGANVFDGDDTTSVDLVNIAENDYLYVGCEDQFHRIHLEINGGFDGNDPSGTASEMEAQFWNGSSWVTENIAYDGTMGWNTTDDDAPTTLNRSGDIVVSMIDPSWTKGGTDGAQTLDNTLYWRRYKVVSSTPVGDSCLLYQCNIGIHSPNALEPLLSGEIQTDHGGTVFVLSMTDEQGSGPLWRTLWAFDAPDVLFSDSTVNYGRGGAQDVGVVGIVQPSFLGARDDGSRHLFIGMNGISYLCPLGPHPDPTNVAYSQWDAWPVDASDDRNGSQYNVGPRIHAIVLPDADFGLPQHQKTLTEIEFEAYEGFDLSSCEVYYRVDRGPWVFIGFADDQSPNFPIVLNPGAEPVGKEFAIALAFDGDASRELRLPRIRDIRMRVMPRPEMSEMLTLTVELDAETVQPGFIDRRSAHNRYEDLKLLTTLGSSVKIVGLDGSVRYGNVLEVDQKSEFNSDRVPRLVADVSIALTTPQVMAE